MRVERPLLGTTDLVILFRKYVGFVCALAVVVIIVFLAEADYGALRSHPGRIWVPIVLILIAGLLLWSAVRLLRSSRSDI